MFELPKIPMFAAGGIVMEYTPTVIGEVGAEAVLPLTDKRAMGMIADSFVENLDYGYAYNGHDSSIRGAIREAVHEEISYLVQALAPYLGDISQSARETATRDTEIHLDIDGAEIARAQYKAGKRLGRNFETGRSWAQ